MPFLLDLAPEIGLVTPSGEGGVERVGLEERLRAVLEDDGEEGLKVALSSLVGLLLDFDDDDPVERRFLRLMTMNGRRFVSSSLWSLIFPVPPRPEEYRSMPSTLLCSRRLRS